MSDQAAEVEVVELHAFFTAWYNGLLVRNDTEFKRLSNVLATEFQIITPDAGVANRQAVLDIVEASWGRYETTPPEPPFKIEIRNFQIRPAPSTNLILATYEEWQSTSLSTEMQGRLSTVVLRDRTDCPNGLEWVHLHECWLPHIEEIDQDFDSRSGKAKT